MLCTVIGQTLETMAELKQPLSSNDYRDINRIVRVYETKGFYHLVAFMRNVLESDEQPSLFFGALALQILLLSPLR